ncbi:MAG: hypothetical protein BMS9Abin37_2471 [Acidobacteriota bacterium]|nr:MAG: hypothetical protein BMS9Abin37_2471 [Acidobacteriota bacterium]
MATFAVFWVAAAGLVAIDEEMEPFSLELLVDEIGTLVRREP